MLGDTTQNRDAPVEQVRSKETQRLTLHIGNMPYNITECDIRKIFRPYQPIHDVIIIKDKSNRPRGFGFVVLDYLKAKTAQNDINQKVFGNRQLRVSIAGC